MFRLYWITALIISSCIAAYFSKNYNDTGKTLYFWMIMITGNVGIYLWTVVSKRSDNIIFDNVLFDMVLDIAYVAAFVYLGCAESFRLINWVGVVTVLAGLWMMKI